MGIMHQLVIQPINLIFHHGFLVIPLTLLVPKLPHQVVFTNFEVIFYSQSIILSLFL